MCLAEDAIHTQDQGILRALIKQTVVDDGELDAAANAHWVRSAQVGVQEIVQAAALPMVARHRFSEAQVTKADFHHLRFVRGNAEACGQHTLQRGQQPRGGLWRFVNRPHVHAQQGDARRFAEDVEERFADHTVARVATVMGPLDRGVNIHLDRNARGTSGGRRRLPGDAIETVQYACGSLTEERDRGEDQHGGTNHLRTYLHAMFHPAIGQALPPGAGASACPTWYCCVWRETPRAALTRE